VKACVNNTPEHTHIYIYIVYAKAPTGPLLLLLLGLSTGPPGAPIWLTTRWEGGFRVRGSSSFPNGCREAITALSGFLTTALRSRWGHRATVGGSANLAPSAFPSNFCLLLGGGAARGVFQKLA